MPNVKKYVTWKPKKVNDNLYKHPNTDNRASIDSNWDIDFTETPYQALDGRYMSYAAHDWALPQARLDALMDIDADFEFTSVTEEQINTFLLEAYWMEWENQAVSVSNFVFTDLRPNEDI